MDPNAKCFQGSNGDNQNGGGDQNNNNKPCNNGTSSGSTTTSSAPEDEQTTAATTASTTESTTTTTESTTTTTTAPSTTTAPQEEEQTQTDKPGSSGDCGNVTIKCTKAGFYGHPTNCTKFYRCVDFQGDGKAFTIFHFDCGVCKDYLSSHC